METHLTIKENFSIMNNERLLELLTQYECETRSDVAAHLTALCSLVSTLVVTTGGHHVAVTNVITGQRLIMVTGKGFDWE